MCIVSFITTPTTTTTPFTPQITVPQVNYTWTRDTWAEYKEIIERLKALDEKLGLKDCEDPEKAAWMKEVEDRLSRLEVQESLFGTHIKETVNAFRPLKHAKTKKVK